MTIVIMVKQKFDFDHWIKGIKTFKKKVQPI
jgi:hypothetical protein